MSRLPPELRRRATPAKASDAASASEDNDSSSKAAVVLPEGEGKPDFSLLDLGLLTVVGIVLRFWKISEPDSVVFDEYHFGKFVNW